MRLTVLIALVVSSFVLSTGAHAAADGPDRWDIANIAEGDSLIIHGAASARSPAIGAIPAGTRGIRNLGCTGVPTIAEWQVMTEAERIRAVRARWCRIEHAGVRGWVAGRFLAEGAGPSGAPNATPIGPWLIKCQPGCWIEQAGLGARQRTVLRIDKLGPSEARITITRSGIAQRGVLTIAMDGKTTSQGPIAPLAGPGRGRLVMQPDDITAGLVRQMSVHKNMVLTFPGEPGVEFHLDKFALVWRDVGPSK